MGNIGRVIGEELGVCVKEGRGDEYMMGNGKRVMEQEDGRERGRGRERESPTKTKRGILPSRFSDNGFRSRLRLHAHVRERV